VGRRGFLVLYSLLMASSGAALELSKSLYVIAPALFLSGMSTTGTEAGPFQSVEVSVVSRLARRPGRALGAYNLLGSSAALLLARQGLSQMDVPTRQAFIAEIFDEEERVRAFAVTNTFRSLAGLPGPLLVGAMLSSGLLGMPFVLSGAVKAGYDSSIYLLYRDR